MHAIATRHAPHEFSLLIGKRDGKSVVLQLTAHLEGFTPQQFAHAGIPLCHILLAVGIGQREHGIAMGHLGELLVEVAAHALCGRVGVGHLGMPGLQVLQLMHQEVELLVADDGLVEHIVTVVMLVQLAPQLLDSVLLGHNECLCELAAKLRKVGRKTKRNEE